MSITTEVDGNGDTVNKLHNTFESTGYISGKSIEEVMNKYRNGTSQIISIIGVNDEEKENSEIVDATIDSVDDGLSNGIRTCINGSEFLYIDEYNVFLMNEKGEEIKYEASEAKDDQKKIDYISFNDRYIFYYQKGKGMYMIDRFDNTESRIMSSIVPAGIRAIDDKVYVYQPSALGDVKEIGSGEVIDILDQEDEDKKKDEYVYEHEAVDYYLFLDNQDFEIRACSDPDYLTDNSWLEGTNPITIPARTAVIGSDIYMVVQSSYRHVVYPHQYMKGNGSFDKEALIKYTPSTNKTEILYIIEDNSEQIVNFSVDNNSLYLYSGGEIYISDLKGSNKTKLCDVPDADMLYFEYLNDQLLIYDENNKLLGRY